MHLVTHKPEMNPLYLMITVCGLMSFGLNLTLNDS